MGEPACLKSTLEEIHSARGKDYKFLQKACDALQCGHAEPKINFYMAVMDRLS